MGFRGLEVQGIRSSGALGVKIFRGFGGMGFGFGFCLKDFGFGGAGPVVPLERL